MNATDALDFINKILQVIRVPPKTEIEEAEHRALKRAFDAMCDYVRHRVDRVQFDYGAEIK